MRNQYKILSEKYSQVNESEKEDILGGLDAVVAANANKSKPAYMIVFYSHSDDMDFYDQKTKVPEDAIPIPWNTLSDDIQSMVDTEQAPGIFYLIDEDPHTQQSMFVYYLTDRISKELAKRVFHATRTWPGSPGETLRQGLIEYPPFVEWSEENEIEF